MSTKGPSAARVRLASMPTRDHLALLIDRLEIIDAEKFLALERFVFDIVQHAEEDLRRRMHRPKPL